MRGEVGGQVAIDVDRMDARARFGERQRERAAARADFEEGLSGAGAISRISLSTQARSRKC